MYDLRRFLLMMRDPVRVEAHARAISEVVKPGDTVIDVGCGTGILSLMALDAGAAKVIAIDTNPAVELFRLVTNEHPRREDLTILRGDARRAKLAAADVVLGDLRGAMPILGTTVTVLRDVSRRWLKPHGRLLPVEDEIFIAPITCSEGFEAVAGWRRTWSDVAYDRVATHAGQVWFRQSIRADQVLAPALGAATVHWADPAADQERTLAFTIERPADMHGLGAWFRTTLAPGLSYDTSPTSPRQVYQQVFFPLYQAVSVQPGDVAELRFGIRSLTSRPIWRWNVRLLRQGHRLVDERHSSFGGELLSEEDLRGRRPEFVPRLGHRAEVDAFILAAADGESSVQEIATRLAARFPSEFPTWQAALGRVGNCLSRYLDGDDRS